MRRMHQSQSKGFAIVEVIIAVVIILILVGIAFWVYKQQSEDDDTDMEATTSQSADTDEATTLEAPEIRNTQDLTEAAQWLDGIDLDAAEHDDAALNAEANAL